MLHQILKLEIFSMFTQVNIVFFEVNKKILGGGAPLMLNFFRKFLGFLLALWEHVLRPTLKFLIILVLLTLAMASLLLLGGHEDVVRTLLLPCRDMVTTLMVTGGKCSILLIEIFTFLNQEILPIKDYSRVIQFFLYVNLLIIFMVALILLILGYFFKLTRRTLAISLILFLVISLSILGLVYGYYPSIFLDLTMEFIILPTMNFLESFILDYWKPGLDTLAMFRDFLDNGGGGKPHE